MIQPKVFSQILKVYNEFMSHSTKKHKRQSALYLQLHIYREMLHYIIKYVLSNI